MGGLCVKPATALQDLWVVRWSVHVWLVAKWMEHARSWIVVTSHQWSFGSIRRRVHAEGLSFEAVVISTQMTFFLVLTCHEMRATVWFQQLFTCLWISEWFIVTVVWPVCVQRDYCFHGFCGRHWCGYVNKCVKYAFFLGFVCDLVWQVL